MTALSRDDWLSALLGKDAWCIPVQPSGLDEPTITAIRERLHAPVFLYAKVPTTDMGTVASLSALGFHTIDTNVTLARKVTNALCTIGAPICRFAAPADHDAVRTLAGRCFSYSRLHLDPSVPRQIADRSRAEWAGNFFLGQRGDHMVVAKIDGACAGFLQLLGPRDGALVIDLIGVDEKFRRRGVARNMIAFAASQLDGVNEMRVGTQIANVPSIRLYEELGFRTVETQYVLHSHGI